MNIETDPILMILFSLIEHFNISQDDPENTEPEPIGTRTARNQKRSEGAEKKKATCEAVTDFLPVPQPGQNRLQEVSLPCSQNRVRIVPKPGTGQNLEPTRAGSEHGTGQKQAGSQRAASEVGVWYLSTEQLWNRPPGQNGPVPVLMPFFSLQQEGGAALMPPSCCSRRRIRTGNRNVTNQNGSVVLFTQRSEPQRSEPKRSECGGGGVVLREPPGGTHLQPRDSAPKIQISYCSQRATIFQDVCRLTESRGVGGARRRRPKPLRV